MNEPWDDPQTIGELESDLEDALAELVDLDRRGELAPELRALLWLAPREGSSVHVSLRRRDGSRQHSRKSALAEWNPARGGAWIVFESPSLAGDPHAPSTGVPLDDFILALDQAEKDPHLSFISLKWFRDTYLQKHGYAWASDPDLPRRVIQEATELQVLVMHKVPNPKQPEYPVTSIRLNRESPDVQRVLAQAGRAAGGDAHQARETTQ